MVQKFTKPRRMKRRNGKGPAGAKRVTEQFLSTGPRKGAVGGKQQGGPRPAAQAIEHANANASFKRGVVGGKGRTPKPPSDRAGSGGDLKPLTLASKPPGYTPTPSPWPAPPAPLGAPTLAPKPPSPIRTAAAGLSKPMKAVGRKKTPGPERKFGKFNR